MNNTQLAERIKARCKEKNITISRLIQECELSKSFIYDIEKRDKSPSVDKIERIAELLECSVDYLMGRDVYWKINPKINDGYPYLNIFEHQLELEINKAKD